MRKTKTLDCAWMGARRYQCINKAVHLGRGVKAPSTVTMSIAPMVRKDDDSMDRTGRVGPGMRLKYGGRSTANQREREGAGGWMPRAPNEGQMPWLRSHFGDLGRVSTASCGRTGAQSCEGGCGAGWTGARGRRAQHPRTPPIGHEPRPAQPDVQQHGILCPCAATHDVNHLGRRDSSMTISNTDTARTRTRLLYCKDPHH